MVNDVVFSRILRCLKWLYSGPVILVRCYLHFSWCRARQKGRITIEKSVISSWIGISLPSVRSDRFPIANAVAPLNHENITSLSAFRCLQCAHSFNEGSHSAAFVVWTALLTLYATFSKLPLFLISNRSAGSPPSDTTHFQITRYFLHSYIPGTGLNVYIHQSIVTPWFHRLNSSDREF